MSSETAIPPPVLWAQRKEDVFLTFNLESKDPTIKVEKDSVYFKGVNSQDNKTYEVNIQLYDNIVPENSTHTNKGRFIEMVLRKEKTDASYWPSLSKDKKKPYYVKVDFNKWNDEDDENEERGDDGPGGLDLSEMLQSMGGGGGAGDNPKPTFDDLEESDSDDEVLPDLE